MCPRRVLVRILIHPYRVNRGVPRLLLMLSKGNGTIIVLRGTCLRLLLILVNRILFRYLEPGSTLFWSSSVLPS